MIIMIISVKSNSMSSVQFEKTGDLYMSSDK